LIELTTDKHAQIAILDFSIIEYLVHFIIKINAS